MKPALVRLVFWKVRIDIRREPDRDHFLRQRTGDANAQSVGSEFFRSSTRYEKQNEDDRVLHFLGVRVGAVGGEFHGTSPIRGQ
jgi:hypothetical protein